MGYDIYGIKPKNKKGEYFRNAIEWWPSIWSLASLAPGITEEDRLDGYFNGGLRIKGKKHRSIITFLEAVMKHPEEFVEQLTGKKPKRKHTPTDDVIEICLAFGLYPFEGTRKELRKRPFDWGNVKDFVKFLKNNEGFKIW